MNDERPFFRQTQNAGGLLFVGLAALLVVVVALVSSPTEPLLFGLGLAIAGALLLVHTVQIGVDDEALTVRLGVGIISWRVELKDIESVETIPLERMGGLPVRRESDGWVVGFGQGEVVRVEHSGGSALYVATEEPIELTLALRERGAPSASS